MDKTINGNQTNKYFKEYYLKNKERISERNKELYLKRRSTKDGLEKERKRATEYTRKYRKNNPEKQKLARKRAYNNRKLKAIKIIGEAKCNRCGCDELDFLEFNHIGGNGCKDWRENKGVAMMDRVIAGRKTDDLEILCRVCNAVDFLERKNNNQAKRFRINWT